jgi:phosphate transport system substrate-binding protein
VKHMLAARAIGVVAIATIGAAACGSNNSSGGGSVKAGSTSAADCASGSLSGQGSTFQQNIEKQWTSDFAQKCSGAQISYEGTGSGAGIQQFGSGTVDYAGSDAVMKPDEQAAANKRCAGTAIHIPVTAGGIAIIYNLKGVSSLKLSAPTLAGIFDGSIKTWNDAKIKADNSGVTLPSTPIKSFHRADGSGTTKVFTGFLAADAPKDWKLGSDKTINWPSGQAAKGSDGVVAGVKQTDGGVTYAEVSFAKQNSLPTAQVKGVAGDYSDISADTVSKSINDAFTISGTGSDLAGTLDFTKMTGYPISTVSYVITCEKYSDANKSKLLKAFLNYDVTTGQQAADSLGFAPLPQSLVSKAQTSISSIS